MFLSVTSFSQVNFKLYHTGNASWYNYQHKRSSATIGTSIEFSGLEIGLRSNWTDAGHNKESEGGKDLTGFNKTLFQLRIADIWILRVPQDSKHVWFNIKMENLFIHSGIFKHQSNLTKIGIGVSAGFPGWECFIGVLKYAYQDVRNDKGNYMQAYEYRLTFRFDFIH